MNGVGQQVRDDFRALLTLACAGHNLSPGIAEAVKTLGPQSVLRTLTIAPQVLNRADDAPALYDVPGLTVLTAASAFWPWSQGTLESPAPLVLWATGQLEILTEPLVNLSTNPDEQGSASAEWEALDVATGLSDAGHVLVGVTHIRHDELVLRAAKAMGGRWVGVCTDLLDGQSLALLGDSSRGVLLSAAPPLLGPRVRSSGTAEELLSRLVDATVDIPAAIRVVR